MIVAQQTSLTKKSTYLRALANNAIDLVSEVIEDIADEIIEDAVSNYESAAPGETYVRTGDLGRGWRRTKAIDTGREIVVEITNAVTEREGKQRPYASLVQGLDRTNRHEEAGWFTIFEIQQFHSHEQTNRVRAALRKGR